MSTKGGKLDASGQSISSIRLVTDTDADTGIGTSLDPVRVDPTGTTVQPVSFVSAQHVIVDSGGGSNGSVGTTASAVPASATYVGGNKAGNLTGLSLDGSGNLNVNLAAGSISGGNAAASATGSAVPASADYTGFNSGGNLVGVSTANPLPVSQQGTVTVSGTVGLTSLPAAPANTGVDIGNVGIKASQTIGLSAGSAVIGHVITDTGSTVSVSNFPATQPVSGTVTANAGTGTMAVSAASLPLPTGAATLAKQPALGTAGTASADVLTVQGIASMTALKVDGSGVTQPVSGTFFQATQPVSGTVTANQGGTWTVQPGNTANTTAWKVDGSAVTQPVSVAATLTVQGGKTNNNAAPGATNIGSLPSLANAALPAWTEGDQVTQSVDLSGGLRVVSRPPVVLGAYRLAVTTAVYTALGAGSALISFRWTDATKICLVTKVRVFVTTTTASGAAGRIDRALIPVRGFTVADSGGTAITLTGNNQKMRTSQATTVVGGVQVSSGSALTLGTGTADANPIGVIAKQGAAAEPIGLTIPPEDLFNYNADQNYPLVLAANEGFRITIPTAMPTTIAQQTSAIIEWQEIATSGTF